MSFCAAHFRLAAWADENAVAQASASKSFFMVPPLSLFNRERFLDQRGEIAGAERNHFIVEIVVWIVQETGSRLTPGSAPLAEKHVGPGPRLQHVGEVFAAHCRLVLGD